MDTPTESSVFGTSFLRFCRCVAEREWEYSIGFTASNAHHTFWDKMCFVMILATSRASVGEPFRWFCLLLGTLFEVLSLTAFEVNRQSVSNSGKHRQTAGAVCGGVSKQITSMTSLWARTDPEQVPKTKASQGPIEKSLIDQGIPGTDRQESHRGAAGPKEYSIGTGTPHRYRGGGGYIIYIYIYIFIHICV